MKDFKTSHHIYLAAAIFFMLVTAQTLWSTIHGDGAVYAWMIREICSNASSLLDHPLAWMRTSFFIDHPYFFFYFSAPISKLFGTGDIGIKIPNYIVGFISLSMVYKTSRLYTDSFWPGLLAGYVLITNPLYELMLKQPTLDPLAQLLSLLSIFILITSEKPNSKKIFISGLLMGFAFLTKGLELLPNLGALFFSVCILIKRMKLNPFKTFFWGLFGLTLPIMAWISFDFIFWKQIWIHQYFDRQFKGRFFSEANTQTALNFNYLKNLLSKYFIQLGIIVWGTFKSIKSKLTLSLFWWYTVVYIVLNILAFSIIKKDSSQHMTGIFLFSSILIGEYIYTFYKSIQHQKIKNILNQVFPYFHYTLGCAALIMWIWFMTHQNNKDDMWTFIKNQAAFFEKPENQIPVVLADDVDDITGVYFTAQWYWPKNKIYFTKEAENLLNSQEIFQLTKVNDKSFKINRSQFVLK